MATRISTVESPVVVTPIADSRRQDVTIPQRDPESEFARTCERITLSSHLEFDVVATPDRFAGGLFRPIGSMPGQVQVPLGEVPYLVPRDLTAESVDRYAHELRRIAARSLYLRRCRQRDIVQRLCEQLPELEELIFENCGPTPYPIASLPNLSRLSFRNEPCIDDIQFLEDIQTLEHLVIYRCNNVFASGIPSLVRLTALILVNIPSVVNFEGLIDHLPECMPTLSHVEFNRCRFREGEIDLTPLAQLPHLSRFRAANTIAVDRSGRFERYLGEREAITKLLDSLVPSATTATISLEGTHNEDLADLVDKCGDIEELTINDCNDLTDLAPLAGFDSLKTLAIERLGSITSLAPLIDIPSLQRLSIRECRSIADYRCLRRCGNLVSLTLAPAPSATLDTSSYQEQAVDIYLHFSRTPDFSFDCGISEADMLALIDRVPQFITAVKAELRGDN